MLQQPEIRNIDICVTVDDLLGPLGYDDKEAVQPSIMEQIVSESRRCHEAMEGKAIYACGQFSRLAGRHAIEAGGVTVDDETLAASLNGAKALAVAVCTVGPGIDEIIKDHFSRGDFLRGMIADVVASRATENVADKCAAIICAEAAKLKLSPLKHLSPGYGKWDVSGQRPVFSLLDPSPIGVSLNDHCMMTPQKSVSFVIPLVEGKAQRQEGRRCDDCGYVDCTYRRK